MGALEQQRLKRRLIAALTCSGLLLVTLSGWNLGSYQQDNPSDRIAANSRSVNQMIRERLKLCERENKKLIVGAARKNETDHHAKLVLEGSLLGRENELLSQTNEDLSKSNGECEEEMARIREERYGTREVDTAEVIARLTFENGQLEAALRQGLRTGQDPGSGELRDRVAALRLENKALQEDLRARMAEQRHRREAEGRAHKRAEEEASGKRTRATPAPEPAPLRRLDAAASLRRLERAAGMVSDEGAAARARNPPAPAADRDRNPRAKAAKDELRRGYAKRAGGAEEGQRTKTGPLSESDGRPHRHRRPGQKGGSKVGSDEDRVGHARKGRSSASAPDGAATDNHGRRQPA